MEWNGDGVQWTFSASPAIVALSIRLLLSYSPMLDPKCVWGGNLNKNGLGAILQKK